MFSLGHRKWKKHIINFQMFSPVYKMLFLVVSEPKTQHQISYNVAAVLVSRKTHSHQQ